MALFAQHYIIVTILIIVATVAFSIWLHCYIEKQCNCNRKKYHNRASAVVCLLLCFVLIVPSFIGIDKEYFSSSMTSDEWEEFVASFKTDYGGKADEDLFNKYDTVVDELASWDKLSADKRITLLNKV